MKTRIYGTDLPFEKYTNEIKRYILEDLGAEEADVDVEWERSAQQQELRL